MGGPSKARIDKAGRLLSTPPDPLTEEYLELEDVFDTYRKTFLPKLTELTSQIQFWLTNNGEHYYIAQRLKRKPQILRKLRRLSARLTQLQDIGGCRIIVRSNRQVDELKDFIEKKIAETEYLNLVRATDYRPRGRDDSGYRAVHLIIENKEKVIELQIRSMIQHYWAESIERTSVIYGSHLKEQEGDPVVIKYFKNLSDIFYELEAGRQPGGHAQVELDTLRRRAEEIIEASGKGKALGTFVNDDIMRTLAEKERSSAKGINNWIFVFDWNSGSFITWDIVDRDPDQAADTYSKYERQYPAEDQLEVVLIGSSDVSTVRKTHSHYFGVAAYDKVLESLQDSIVGFSKRMELDVGARQILGVLARRRFWGSKKASEDTLRNHFCKDVITFDGSLKSLRLKGFVSTEGGVSLEIKRKSEIEQYL
ncbi:RelA/SpoT domain-containing protein [Hyphomicrobium zavarzinii]|uniref:RelA/SpoT domain-containing protein n=1 Tax=Hyphomicrobium zavarzinii TaxID=48292 RepID=UPI0003AAF07A|nr:RelA/SpoT domain-containing protein [Hyphomicrobium zavarzinii]